MRQALQVLLVLALLGTRVAAFSLLGPYADWMDYTKSYRQPWDIGGPMNIGEGYRWNIPVVTYGFERSFLDYLGSNGVAAVEEAIAILNRLPPASEIDLEDHPIEPWQYNFHGYEQNLTDWTLLTTLTNSGAPFLFEFGALPGEISRFFRTIPER